MDNFDILDQIILVASGGVLCLVGCLAVFLDASGALT